MKHQNNRKYDQNLTSPLILKPLLTSILKTNLSNAQVPHSVLPLDSGGITFGAETKYEGGKNFFGARVGTNSGEESQVQRIGMGETDIFQPKVLLNA